MELVAKSGNLDKCKSLIIRGNKDFHEGLYGAAEGGHLKLVKFFVTLIETHQCTNHNYKSVDYDKLFEAGAKGGHLNICRYFYINTDFEKAMFTAAYYGRKDICKIDNDSYRASKIRGASKGGHVELCNYFIAQIDICDYNYLLREVASGGCLGICKYLVEEHGANDYYGALLEATKEGHLDLCKYFAGFKDAYNDDILMNAFQYGHVEICKYFRNTFKDISISKLDKYISNAAWEGNLEMLKYLIFCLKNSNIELDAKADLKTFATAAGRGHIDICEFLIGLEYSKYQDEHRKRFQPVLDHINYAPRSTGYYKAMTSFLNVFK